MDWLVVVVGVVVLILLFVVPVSVYLCVKLGTLGHLKALTQYKKKEQTHGGSAEASGAGTPQV